MDLTEASAMEPENAMADDIQALWSRTDEHGKAIKDLELKQVLTEETLKAHQEEFRRMCNESSKNHGELMATIKSVAADVSTVMTDFHRRQGEDGIKRWLIPVLLTAIGLLVAYITASDVGAI